MVELIGRLVERGHAYAAEGHVLFSVSSFPEYGRFSGRDREELLAGARIDRIAAAARINKAQLYHYVGNKDALFAAALPFVEGDAAVWTPRLVVTLTVAALLAHLGAD